MPQSASVKKVDRMATMKISDTTRDRLRAMGAMGDTFDDVIVKLLDEHEAAAPARKTVRKLK